MDYKYPVSLLMLLLMKCQLFNCDDAYISLETGKDINECGTKTRPCKSIEFTFKYIAQSSDIIYIDGGKYEALVYKLNQTVIVNQTIIAIKKMLGSKLDPIITTQLSHSSAFLFQSHSSVIFESIYFKTTSLACFKSMAIFDLRNCTFRGGSLIDSMFDIALNIINSYVTGAISFRNTNPTVIIRNTTFEYFSFRFFYPLPANTTAQFFISESNFYQSKIYAWSGHRISLRANAFYDSGVDVTFVNNLLVTKCIFQGTYSIHTIATDYIAFTQSVFKGFYTRVWFDIPGINLTRTKKLIISNCLFVGNGRKEKDVTSHNFKILHTPLAYLIDCKFENNLSLDGGGFSIENSKVCVYDSIFLYNDAVWYGGSLHGGDHNSELILINTVIVGSGMDVFPRVIGRLIYSRGNLRIHNVSLLVNFTTASSPIVFVDGDSNSMTFSSSYSMTCPLGYTVQSEHMPFQRSMNPRYYTFVSFFSSYCLPCGKGKYSLKRGMEFTSKNLTHFGKNDVKCFACPLAGVCDSNIVSAGNYWGYQIGDQIRFIPCPIHYCCSSTASPCLSFDTCEKNRGGILCGTCKEGFSLDLFSSKCIENERCTLFRTVLFWIFNVLLASVYSVLLLYMNEISLFLKRMLTIEPIHAPRSDSLTEPLLDVVTYVSPISSNNTSTKYLQSKKTLSGLIKIVFFFYQVESLLRVNTPVKGAYQYNSWLIRSVISSIFNIKVNSDTKGFHFCIITGLNTVGKALLKISGILNMFFFLFLLYGFSRIVDWYKHRKQIHYEIELDEESVFDLGETVPTYSYLPFSLRIKCCFIKLALLAYMTISTFLFQCVNCVSVRSTSHLYIQGNIVCYQTWQWILIAVIVIWVAPFCLTLYFSSRLLFGCSITPNEFYFTLCLPPSVIYYYIRSKLKVNAGLPKKQAIAAKHILSSLYAPFRMSDTDEEPVIWESVSIFRRLMLVLAFTYIINPVVKLYVLQALLVIYLFHHVKVQPYEDSKLNLIETGSIALLCMLASINVFWAHIYMTNATNFPSFKKIGEAFLFFEISVLVLPILGGVIIVLFCILRKLITVGHKQWSRKEE